MEIKNNMDEEVKIEDNGSLKVENLIKVLQEFPKDTPVFFVSTTPEIQFEVSCEYFNDFIEVEGEHKPAVVFLYKPVEKEEVFEVEQPELGLEI